MPDPITTLRRAASCSAALLVAAAALQAQVTSAAESLLTVTARVDAGSAGASSGTLPIGPKPTGYTLRAQNFPLLPGDAEAQLTPGSPTHWTLVEHAIVHTAFNHSVGSNTGPHRTRLRFTTAARPVAGLLSLRVTADSVQTALGQSTMQASVGGTSYGFQPGSASVAIPVLLEVGAPLDVLVDSAARVYVPRMSFTVGETARIGLDVEFVPTPDPCTVTEVGAGCGSVELDTWGDPTAPTRQVLRFRDRSAMPRIALVGVGTQVGATRLGNHPITGQACTLWPALLLAQPLALDANGAAGITFDTAPLPGLDLVTQAATVDAAGVASFSRGLRLRFP